jgi:ABC-type antimicrobial peptide transport system permease subunit
LVVLQYIISIVFITSSIGIYYQYSHFVSYDLGYNTENILNISVEGNDLTLLKNELAKLPEVMEVSQSAMVTSIRGYDWNENVKFALNPQDSVRAGVNYIDENYLPLHRHAFLAGRNFLAKPSNATETEVIVTQSLLKELNIQDQNPEKAIGEVLRIRNKHVQIIGVIKDFQFDVASEGRRRSALFRYSKDHSYWLNVKLQSKDLIESYSKVEAAWKRIDPIHPLDAKFYNEQIEQSFSKMKAYLKLAGFISFLAVSISSLGLLGMVVFATEIRVKEISIRKVLGASDYKLFYQLSRGFLILLLIAAVTGVEITWLIFTRVLFVSMANPAPLHLVQMLLGVFVTLVLALVMIFLQTLKITRTNPTEILRIDH